jgi:hypothetical protein
MCTISLTHTHPLTHTHTLIHTLSLSRNIGQGTIADNVVARVNSLKGLQKRLKTVIQYLTLVQNGKIPQNFKILNNIQVCVCGCVIIKLLLL